MRCLLLLLLPSLALAEPTPEITVKGDTVHVAVPASPSAPTGEFPVTLEPYVITASFGKNELVEADLGGSGYALDLNGDGDTDDTLPAKCLADGAAEVAGVRLEPLGLPEMRYVDAKGGSKVKRLGEKGAYGVLYAPCKDSAPISFGVSAEPIEIGHFKGPALQLMVFQPGPPGSKPTFEVSQPKLDGEPVEVEAVVAYDYEQFFGPKPQWMVMRWMMIPLGDTAAHTVELELKGEAKLVVAMLNYGPAPNVRKRGPVKGTQLSK